MSKGITLDEEVKARRCILVWQVGRLGGDVSVPKIKSYRVTHHTKNM